MKRLTRRMANVLVLFNTLMLLMPHFSWSLTTMPSAGFQASVIQGSPLKIPASMARITAVHQGQGPTTIIHIADVHCQYEVQQHISQLLDYLKANHHLSLVMVEGASQAIDVGKLGSFPDRQAKRLVGRYLMRQGKITGAEYSAAMSSSPLVLEGVEDQALYDQSQAALEGFFNYEAQGLVKDLLDRLEQLKPALYSPELAAFDQGRENYQKGQTSLRQYAYFLAQAARRQGMTLQAFPQILTYLKSSDASLQGQDPDALLAAMDHLDQALRRRLYRNENATRLDQFIGRARLLERLLNISLNPQEWQALRLYPEHYTAQSFKAFLRGQQGQDMMEPLSWAKLWDYIDQARIFYKQADQRSHVLAAKAIAVIKQKSVPLAVLITGGFHTNDILQDMKTAGMNYIALQPQMTKMDMVNPYFQLLTRKMTPLEQLLGQNQIHFALPTNFPLMDHGASKTLANLAMPIRGVMRSLELLLKSVWAFDQLETGHSLVSLSNTYQALQARYAEDGGVQLDFAQARRAPESSAIIIPVLQDGRLLDLKAILRRSLRRKTPNLGIMPLPGQWELVTCRENQVADNLPTRAEAMQPGSVARNPWRSWTSWGVVKRLPGQAYTLIRRGLQAVRADAGQVWALALQQTGRAHAVVPVVGTGLWAAGLMLRPETMNTLIQTMVSPIVNSLLGLYRLTGIDSHRELLMLLGQYPAPSILALMTTALVLAGLTFTKPWGQGLAVPVLGDQPFQWLERHESPNNGSGGNGGQPGPSARQALQRWLNQRGETILEADETDIYTFLLDNYAARDIEQAIVDLKKTAYQQQPSSQLYNEALQLVDQLDQVHWINKAETSSALEAIPIIDLDEDKILDIILSRIRHPQYEWPVVLAEKNSPIFDQQQMSNLKNRGLKVLLARKDIWPLIVEVEKAYHDQYMSPKDATMTHTCIYRLISVDDKDAAYFRDYFNVLRENGFSLSYARDMIYKRRAPEELKTLIDRMQKLDLRPYVMFNILNTSLNAGQIEKALSHLPQNKSWPTMKPFFKKLDAPPSLTEQVRSVARQWAESGLIEGAVVDELLKREPLDTADQAKVFFSHMLDRAPRLKSGTSPLHKIPIELFYQKPERLKKILQWEKKTHMDLPEVVLESAMHSTRNDDEILAILETWNSSEANILRRAIECAWPWEELNRLLGMMAKAEISARAQEEVLFSGVGVDLLQDYLDLLAGMETRPRGPVLIRLCRRQATLDDWVLILQHQSAEALWQESQWGAWMAQSMSQNIRMDIQNQLLSLFRKEPGQDWDSETIKQTLRQLDQGRVCLLGKPSYRYQLMVINLFLGHRLSVEELGRIKAAIVSPEEAVVLPPECKQVISKMERQQWLAPNTLASLENSLSQMVISARTKDQVLEQLLTNIRRERSQWLARDQMTALVKAGWDQFESKAFLWDHPYLREKLEATNQYSCTSAVLKDMLLSPLSQEDLLARIELIRNHGLTASAAAAVITSKKTTEELNEIIPKFIKLGAQQAMIPRLLASPLPGKTLEEIVSRNLDLRTFRAALAKARPAHPFSTSPRRKASKKDMAIQPLRSFREVVDTMEKRQWLSPITAATFKQIADDQWNEFTFYCLVESMERGGHPLFTRNAQVTAIVKDGWVQFTGHLSLWNHGYLRMKLSGHKDYLCTPEVIATILTTDDDVSNLWKLLDLMQQYGAPEVLALAMLRTSRPPRELVVLLKRFREKGLSPTIQSRLITSALLPDEIENYLATPIPVQTKDQLEKIQTILSQRPQYTDYIGEQLKPALADDIISHWKDGGYTKEDLPFLINIAKDNSVALLKLPQPYRWPLLSAVYKNALPADSLSTAAGFKEDVYTKLGELPPAMRWIVLNALLTKSLKRLQYRQTTMTKADIDIIAGLPESWHESLLVARIAETVRLLGLQQLQHAYRNQSQLFKNLTSYQQQSLALMVAQVKINVSQLDKLSPLALAASLELAAFPMAWQEALLLDWANKRLDLKDLKNAAELVRDNPPSDESITSLRALMAQAHALRTAEESAAAELMTKTVPSDTVKTSAKAMVVYDGHERPDENQLMAVLYPFIHFWGKRILAMAGFWSGLNPALAGIIIPHWEDAGYTRNDLRGLIDLAQKNSEALLQLPAPYRWPLLSAVYKKELKKDDLKTAAGLNAQVYEKLDQLPPSMAWIVLNALLAGRLESDQYEKTTMDKADIKIIDGLPEPCQEPLLMARIAKTIGLQELQKLHRLSENLTSFQQQSLASMVANKKITIAQLQNLNPLSPEVSRGLTALPRDWQRVLLSQWANSRMDAENLMEA